MWSSLKVKLGILTMATLVIGFGACGGEDKTSAKEAVTTGKSESTAGVERFLLARGEEPGYRPGGPVTKVSSLRELPPPLRARARLLRDRGFVSLISRPLQGNESAGVTSLLLFTNAAGARREATQQRRDLEVDFRGWTLKRFDVPGVPGAFGSTARNGSHRVGNVTWVEGRCVMTLGNEAESSSVAPLRAGVQAVHRRVAGRCP